MLEFHEAGHGGDRRQTHIEGQRANRTPTMPWCFGEELQWQQAPGPVLAAVLRLRHSRLLAGWGPRTRGSTGVELAPDLVSRD